MFAQCTIFTVSRIFHFSQKWNNSTKVSKSVKINTKVQKKFALDAAELWAKQCVLSQEASRVVTGESKTNMKWGGGGGA